MGTASTASNVSIVLRGAGTVGNVIITVDDGLPGAPVAAVPRLTIDISQDGVHKVEVEVPDTDTAWLYWLGLTYDHDCL